MSAVQVFAYDDTEIRTVLADGDPWFVAADIARPLGYRMASDMTRRLDEDDRGTRSVRTPSGQQDMTVISEAGLYVAILGSKVPGARAFKRWVTHEVLPAIRRTGRYDTTPAIPQTYAEALQLAADQARQIEDQAAKLAVAAPKAESWDTLASADGDWSVRDAAKVLSRDPVIALGERRLFTILAQREWIFRQRGDGRWRAYQRAIDAGWLSELPASHYHPRSGELVLDAPQVRVTTKGLHDLHRRLGGSQPLRTGQQLELLTNRA
ncbi:phage antirepressor KilAC domain-containing protein [Micromonospora sp. WMMA1363]|uniref:phage antirepressor KilAC domain-containing protein n=1 Tax=Micromonospora sp. WMMA1363 TaxID=3053985 RepID=UPI00259CB260|nr:phage antirepressor KilAC domain-containing protein [Micromonospora sp. WMMA1363]MDM4721120.1 phage antirepressor KilAC domain-containing protein [Micromonospora sp. WMMA1363]